MELEAALKRIGDLTEENGNLKSEKKTLSSERDSLLANKEKIEGQLHAQKEKAREYKEKLDTAVPEGSVLLSKEDAVRWENLKTVENPEALAAQVVTLQGELATAYGDVTDAALNSAGYTNPLMRTLLKEVRARTNAEGKLELLKGGKAITLEDFAKDVNVTVEHLNALKGEVTPLAPQGPGGNAASGKPNYVKDFIAKERGDSGNEDKP